jgi:hypothetical protein
LNAERQRRYKEANAEKARTENNETVKNISRQLLRNMQNKIVQMQKDILND